MAMSLSWFYIGNDQPGYDQYAAHQVKSTNFFVQQPHRFEAAEQRDKIAEQRRSCRTEPRNGHIPQQERDHRSTQ